MSFDKSKDDAQYELVKVNKSELTKNLLRQLNDSDDTNSDKAEYLRKGHSYKNVKANMSPHDLYLEYYTCKEYNKKVILFFSSIFEKSTCKLAIFILKSY